MGKESKPVYEFGPYRLDANELVLLREGRPVALAPKTFDLLLVLVERHGHLLEKDKLLELVWPNTAVEESNLAYNVSILRKTLGDGETCRLIETVPKRGYRFVAPVKEHRAGANGVRRITVLHPAWLMAPALAAGFWLMSAVRDRPEEPVESKPLTAYAGSELYPDLSPDGNQVAFSWNGSGEGAWSINVQALSSSVPVRLTNGPGDDVSPAWSPDGRTIAYLRLQPDHAAGAIYLIPFPGGAERKLADLQYVRPNPLRNQYGSEIAWHPSGKWLVITDRMAPGTPAGLYLVSTSTGEKRPLLPGPAPPGGDLAAAFRPDGTYLIFVRTKEYGKSDLYGVPVSDDLTVRAKPTVLTSQNGYRTVSPVWTPDGAGIFFLAGPFTGSLRLWRMRGANPGAQRLVPLADDGAEILSTPRRGSDSKLRLAYARSIHDFNVWTIREERAGTVPEPSVLINSTRDDTNAQYSPDGRRIAFLSYRSGSSEIWICGSDGSNPRQVTFFGGSQVGGPTWAPDGERIVFHARPEGTAHVYVVNASGGPVRRLTHDAAQEALPVWSRGGRWVYFYSTRSGRAELWKAPAAGGEPVQVTEAGGVNVAGESLDGNWLFYSRLAEGGVSLWKMPMQSGPAARVLESLANERAFCVVEDGIYFIPAPEKGKRTSICFWSFSSRRTREVAAVEKPPGYGISVFPLSVGTPRNIIWSQLDREGTDLMLAENLRERY